MALFGKKKLSLDEILAGIDNLSDEEKAQLKAKMDDLYKAEDEREIDKIEEDKADDTEKADEKAEEVKDESEEIGKDVDEVKEDVASDEGESGEPAEEAPAETPEENEPMADDNTVQEDKAAEATAEMVQALTDRLAALESTVGELTELKKTMEDYNRKTADRYGYGGQARGDSKSWNDMTADEMKAKMLNGEI